MPELHLQLAQQIADRFAALPQICAVALSGSRGSGAIDSTSDIDLYVYTQGEVPLTARQAIVAQLGGATQANLGLNYWGPGDEWFHAPTGIEIDIVYFGADWMEEQITRVIEQHQASQGYTTCFWHTVRQSRIFYDPQGWLANLQQRCQVEYPEALRQNIVALNYPLLRGIIPAYAHQIEKAVKRRDLVSLNHRTAALLASYFDLLLAVNRQLHPGEKRLIDFALNNCLLLPENLSADLESILLLTAAEVPELPGRVSTLLDHLDRLLEAEGFALEKLQT